MANADVDDGQLIRLSDIDVPAPSHTAGTGLAQIGARDTARHVWTVILDDDPTGTQTVRGLPVLMGRWTDADLTWASQQELRTTFLLTNSRSMPAASAAAATYEIVRRAARVAREQGLLMRVVSRSDSTLRGHFRVEIEASERALADSGRPTSAVVFVPCFLEGGRYTARSRQWVRENDGLVPVAATEFARDRAFGYQESDLLTWVSARMGEPGRAIEALTLDEIRAADGMGAIIRRVSQLPEGAILVADAVQPSDLEVLMLGIQSVEASGTRVLIRSGPSFVRLCAGQPSSPPITAEGITNWGSADGNGLIVVGSHTDLTNRQLRCAEQSLPLTTVELDVRRVLGKETAADELAQCVQTVLSALPTSDVVLRTSRGVIDEGRETPLLTAHTVSRAVSLVVSDVVTAASPRFIVAKGGITSSDVATIGLGVSKAIVEGQMLKGQIPLWSLLDGAQPGLPYVVFPGNVGDERALVDVLLKLTYDALGENA